ncbi:MAG: hypothetical protein KME31_38255 [Tolypothrix carrinoi HA7290-LM1]|nr:hypothetical protein [Tolypothrix carrinoi HA7290-LM1]
MRIFKGNISLVAASFQKFLSTGTSAINRSWIIGRPTLYLVIDVFSRLIVGFIVTLEPPSWLGAMLALENATADKVFFCQGDT